MQILAPQVKPKILAGYEINGPIVTLTCEQNGSKITAKFYDELDSGREIESAVQLPSGDYEIIFTPENETVVTCGMDKSKRSDILLIVGMAFAQLTNDAIMLANLCVEN